MENKWIQLILVYFFICVSISNLYSNPRQSIETFGRDLDTKSISTSDPNHVIRIHPKQQAMEEFAQYEKDPFLFLGLSESATPMQIEEAIKSREAKISAFSSRSRFMPNESTQRNVAWRASVETEKVRMIRGLFEYYLHLGDANEQLRSPRPYRLRVLENTNQEEIARKQKIFYTKAADLGFFPGKYMQSQHATQTAHMMQFYVACAVSELIDSLGTNGDLSKVQNYFLSLLEPRTHAQFMLFSFGAAFGTQGLSYAFQRYLPYLGMHAGNGSMQVASMLGLMIGSGLSDLVFGLLLNPEFRMYRNSPNAEEKDYYMDRLLENFYYDIAVGTTSLAAAVGMLNLGKYAITTIAKNKLDLVAHEVPLTNSAFLANRFKNLALVKRWGLDDFLIRLGHAPKGVEVSRVVIGPHGKEIAQKLFYVGGHVGIMFSMAGTVIMLRFADKFHHLFDEYLANPVRHWFLDNAKKEYIELKNKYLAVADDSTWREIIDLYYSISLIDDRYNDLMKKAKEEHLEHEMTYQQEVYEIEKAYDTKINWAIWLGQRGANVNDPLFKQENVQDANLKWHADINTFDFQKELHSNIRNIFYKSEKEVPAFGPLGSRSVNTGLGMLSIAVDQITRNSGPNNSNFNFGYNFPQELFAPPVVFGDFLYDNYVEQNPGLASDKYYMRNVAKILINKIKKGDLIYVVEDYVQKLREDKIHKIQLISEKYNRNLSEVTSKVYSQDGELWKITKEQLDYFYKEFIVSYKLTNIKNSKEKTQIDKLINCIDVLVYNDQSSGLSSQVCKMDAIDEIHDLYRERYSPEDFQKLQSYLTYDDIDSTIAAFAYARALKDHFHVLDLSGTCYYLKTKENDLYDELDSVCNMYSNLRASGNLSSIMISGMLENELKNNSSNKKTADPILKHYYESEHKLSQDRDYELRYRRLKVTSILAEKLFSSIATYEHFRSVLASIGNAKEFAARVRVR
ncbi:MAG: hypothetical protein ABIA04_08350 [Pseudomonadota bacterium]